MIKITENEMFDFVKIVEQISGNNLNTKKDILLIKLPKFLQELGLNSLSELNEKVQFQKNLKQETMDFITVCETYFFRELEQLKDVIFYIKSLDRPVNVLCAPCSSGEEVYSLAILASENFVKGMNIIGIDINKKMIDKCNEMIYSERSVARLNTMQKTRYFDIKDKMYHLKKETLACRCRFELCNVFDDSLFKLGKFDVIFSRNMMIYFDQDFKIRLMERFYKILNKEGRIYPGKSDLVPETAYFDKNFSAGGVYYSKVD
ncbi:chemotaxis protein CheR [Campylobacter ornithocola]|uniref:Chemotaxis protein CheR n=1 Tax=Campylobacter ornithocola TaxID=1848766 RepID=A0A6M8MS89_9BACT|nr:protein-glutamate O-methyltransferase CheR [Campylobacter ornithocola]OCX42512.1 chemotaxis protein CheR [Campylobacter ornithocola]QKF57292.1 MCP protein methyltransferase [Campylobacter ornithocola]